MSNEQTPSGQGGSLSTSMESEDTAVAAVKRYACSHNLTDLLFPAGASLALSDVMDRIFRKSDESWDTTKTSRYIRHAAGVLDLLVRAACGQEILVKTAYPHQLAVAILYTLPANELTRHSEQSSWQILSEWLPEEQMRRASRHQTMLDITDALFGPQWRPLLGLECRSWTELYEAVLSHKPPFLPGRLHGDPTTQEVLLPRLV